MASLWFVSLLPLLLTLGCARFDSSRPFPVGLYDVPPEKFAQVAGAGFNMVVSSGTDAALEQASRYGLKIIATPPAEEHATTRMAPKQSALWGWYLVDEPDLHFISPEEVGARNRRVHSVSRKPTLVVLASGAAAEPYAKTADMLAVDSYPVPWGPVAMVGREMRLARLGMHGRPFWAVLQAFNWSAFPDLLRTDATLREPTPEEIRCMAYLALLQGARGLLFYSYHAGDWTLPDHPELWRAVSDLAWEIRERASIFGQRVEWWPARTEYHGAPKMMHNELMEARVALGLFKGKANELESRDSYYLIAVNTTAQPVDFSFELPFKNVQTVNTLCDKNAFQVTDRWIRKTYGPYEICIFGPISSPLEDNG